MNYTNYTVQDFVADKYFREWVIQPNKESDAYWNAWMVENAAKAKLVLSARRILLNLAFEEYALPETEVEELWSQIELQIETSESLIDKTANQRYLIPPGASFVSRGAKFGQLRVAASLTILLSMVSLVVYMLFGSQYLDEVEVVTNFGELKTITLPDGSVVKLNSNSKLRYDENWSGVEEREIWLEGEAFFDVIHTKQNTPFKVYANGLEVRVLGTEFNVYGRGVIAKVVLEEGEVKLNSVLSQQSILLVPGDLVTYNTKNLSLNKAQVDTHLYTSWKENKLIFKKTSLEELSNTLKENYNLDFFFIDPNLAQEVFTGVIPTDNQDILIKSLSEAFDINIEMNGNALILRRNNK